MRRLLSYLIAFFVSLTLCNAQNVDRQLAERKRLEKEISVLSSQIHEASLQAKDASATLRLLQKQIDSRRALLKTYDNEIKGYNARIAVMKGEIREMDRHIDSLKFHYDKLIKSVYKTRDPKLWYMYVLASDNLSQAFRRYRYFKNISNEIRKQSVRIEEAQDSLNAQVLKLNAVVEQTQKVSAERKKELVKLEADAAQQKELVASIQKKRKEMERQAAAKRKEAARLDAQIKSIIAQAGSGAVKGKKSKGKKTVVDAKLSKSFASNQGKLPWPADGPVTEKFGQTFHPVFTKVKIRENKGINIAVKPGTNIQCVFNGKVVKVFTLVGYNKCVLVQHGEYFTLYAKLASVAVQAGQDITTGKTIGVIDTIESLTELHFELWKGSKPQNPEVWLAK